MEIDSTNVTRIDPVPAEPAVPADIPEENNEDKKNEQIIQENHDLDVFA